MKKKELSIKQKNADKDLNIIVLFTLIPLFNTINYLFSFWK